MAVDRYCSPTTTTTKGVLIAGGLGNGKTFCMSHGVAYAKSKGLCCMSTAFLADRARILGGVHMHKLFCLPSLKSLSSQRMAEMAIIKLQRSPKRLASLLRMEVLFVD